MATAEQTVVVVAFEAADGDQQRLVGGGGSVKGGRGARVLCACRGYAKKKSRGIR